MSSVSFTHLLNPVTPSSLWGGCSCLRVCFPVLLFLLISSQMWEGSSVMPYMFYFLLEYS